MLQNIIDKVEAAINQQVKDKFGLTDEQTQKTSHAFREEIQNFFSNGGMKNPQFIQSAMKNVSSLEDNEVVVKLKQNLVNALQDKVGLSPEKAAAVRDFSITEFFKTFSEELTDENGNVNIQKILSKFNMSDFEQTAKDLLGNFGGLFGKK
ncbi:MAG TPA: hypothetical protein VLZ75_05615 [Chitinophagales bacterium]|nr:hypothetical protein [Chitinophagales bacterium]